MTALDIVLKDDTKEHLSDLVYINVAEKFITYWYSNMVLFCCIIGIVYWEKKVAEIVSTAC